MTLATDLAVNGFSVIDVLDTDSIHRLSEHYDGLGVDERTPFLATCNDLPRAAARATHDHLVRSLGGVVSRTLPAHAVFLAGYIMKGAGCDGELEFHQDLTYTDERRYRSLLFWIPLVDVDRNTGALRVVPGSHRWTQGLRPGGAATQPTEGFQHALTHRAETIPLRAGQAVIYDAALIHGSWGNHGEHPRPVVALAAAPAGAPLIHFHTEDRAGQSLVGHTVDTDYYLDQSLRSVPIGYHEITPWSRAVAAADLERHLGRGATESPITVSPAPAPPARRRPMSPIRQSRHLGAPSPRRALQDRAMDLRLRRDGFVTVPMIDAGSAAALREQYGRVHGWQGAGFEADLTNDDSAYRRQVSRLLSTALDSLVLSHFVDFAPFLRNFLCKWPGADSALYLHRDWMYVDERNGDRSYVVWIALQDVTGPEGQLQVLRHSHRIDPMLRGTELNGSWLQHEEEIRARLLTIPVRAGDAVIMDNALVHCSLPNHSSEPRVVAAIGVRPASAPLVHFRRCDAGHAVRHDVDDEFFLDTTPQELIQAGTAVPVVELVPTGESSTPSPGELFRRLDASPLSRVDRLRRGRRARHS